MKKIWIRMILAMAALLMLCAGANAATVVCSYEFAGGRNQWTVYSDGTMVISVVPGKSDGEWDFTYDSQPWINYYNAGYIKKVKIESGIKSIGKFWFYGYDLEELHIPSTVDTIAWVSTNSAVIDRLYIEDLDSWMNIRFRDATHHNPMYNAKSVYIDNQLVTNFVVPESVSEIKDYVFYGAPFTSITFHDKLTKIGKYAFSQSEITSLTLPDNLTFVDEYAFENCSKLKSIEIPLRCNPEFEFGVFAYCAALTDVKLSQSMTVVPEGMFSKCSSLETIVIPDRVIHIGDSAFTECKKLKNITLPNGLESLGRYVFQYCPSIETIDLPDSINNLGSNTFYGCTSLKSITIPKEVDGFGGYAFRGCTALEEVILPDTLHSVNLQAFYGCTALEKISLPDGLHTIGDQAFYGCSKLTEIVLPANLSALGSEAFNECTALQSVKFNGPALITIEEDSFTGVTAEVFYSANSSSWTSDMRQNYGGTLTWTSFGGTNSNSTIIRGSSGNHSTYEFDQSTGRLKIMGYGSCSGGWGYFKEFITNVEINNGITSLPPSAFTGAKGLTSLSIPSSVSIIGAYAFSGTGLTTMILPEGVKELGLGAFRNCTNLKSVVIPEGIEEIGDYTFENCTSLVSVVLPETVTDLRYYTFRNCTSLKSIKIPDPVRYLEYSVFENCTSLEEVILSKNIYMLEKDCFANCTSLRRLNIPDSLEGMNERVFYHNPDITLHFSERYDEPFLGQSCFSGANVTLEYHIDNNEWERRADHADYWVEYTGAKSITWKPFAEEGIISLPYNADFSIDCSEYIYDGAEKKPGVSVVLHKTTLKQGVDYTVSYSDNVNVGTGKATITGIGNYKGSWDMYFDIYPGQHPTVSFEKDTITKTEGDGAFSNPLNGTVQGDVVTYSSSNVNVAYVNASTGMIAVKQPGSAVITASIKGNGNYRDTSASFTLSVEKKPEPVVAPNVARLTYSFSNSAKSFGYKSGYRIPLARYKEFFSDTEAKYLYAVMAPWGGSCYGFSSSSMLFNVSGSGLSLSQFGKSKVSSLVPSTKSSSLGMNVQALLETLQISQMLPTPQRYRKAKDVNTVCQAMLEEQAAGRPMVICVRGSGGGHAIVGFKLERVNSTTSRLYVYDCNYPGQTRYITVKNNTSGRYTSWEYKIDDTYGTYWGTGRPNAEIAYVPYSVMKTVWSGRASSGRDTNMLSVSTDNFQIKDYAGNTLAEMKNGVFTSSNDNIYECLPLDDSQFSDNHLIYLPSDLYEIVNTEGGSMEAGMVNTYQSSIVNTTADSVTFAVVDSDECNLVYVDAQAGDNYSVALNSELSSAKDFEEMVFSGVSDGSMVTLGMFGGQLNMSNCDGISLWINGDMVAGSSQDYQRNINEYDIVLEYETCGYTGKSMQPAVTVSSKGFQLTQGVDYVVVYDKNVEIGTATAAVYGIGAYGGVAFMDFEIVAPDSTFCAANGHSWTQTKLEKDPDDEHLRTIHYTCSICGENTTETIGRMDFSLKSYANSTATVTLKNGRDSFASGLYCAVVYDADGYIIAFNVQRVDMESGATADLAVPINSNKTPERVKAFLLDVESYAPMGDAWIAAL